MTKVKKVNRFLPFFWAFFTVLMLSSSFANAGLDYCWKDSYGRGVGFIPSKCSPSQETQGKAPFFTCYNKCPKGYSSTALGGCMQTCPAATYRDAFGNCVDNGAKKRYKYDEYTVVRNPDKCNIFMSGGIEKCFWNSCRKRNGANGCTKHGAAIVAKCKPGYKKAALHCIPDLDCKGFAGKGVDISGKTFCETKRLPPRPPKPADCGKGYVNDAGLCYKTCGKGYNGVGPVCWSKCPRVRGKQWVECGAGCSEDSVSCGTNTTDMVVSVLDSAISIASLGTGSGITKLTKSARKGLTKGIKQAAKQYGKNFTKRFTSGYKKAFKTLTKEGMSKVGVIQDINTLQGSVRGIEGFFNSVQEVVGKDISQEEMDFQIAQQALSYGSLLDPSGVMGVVAAYTKPLCSVIVKGSKSAPGPNATTPLTAGASGALISDQSNLIKMLEMQIKGARNDLHDLTKQATKYKSDPKEHSKIIKKIKLKQNEIREKTGIIAKLKSNKKNVVSSVAPGVVVNTNKPTTNDVTWVLGTKKVGSNYEIFKRNGNTWKKMPGLATQITLDNAGNPWVVNSAGQIFHWVNGKWQKMSGGAMDIGSGGGKTWVIGKNKVPGGYAIYEYAGNKWIKRPGGAVRIDVDHQGNPWVVNSAGQIFHWVKGKWQRMPGGAMDIGSGGGKTWVIGKNKVPGGYAIYEYAGNKWIKRPGGAVRIDVDSKGNPWVLNSGGSIFHWQNSKWAVQPGKGVDIAAR